MSGKGIRYMTKVVIEQFKVLDTLNLCDGFRICPMT